MEVKRSSASRAPTHNEYNELPASSKPHSMRPVSSMILSIAQFLWSPDSNCSANYQRERDRERERERERDHAIWRMTVAG